VLQCFFLILIFTKKTELTWLQAKPLQPKPADTTVGRGSKNVDKARCEAAAGWNQGCQMVYFQTQIQSLGKFLKWKLLEYLTSLT
jgi:hypothetical protein